MKKKICKMLSILLTIMIVFSACLCMFSTVSAATEQSYIVSSSGNDATADGTAPRKAFKTIGKAIEFAKAAGLKAGDTVNLKIYGTTAVSWLAEGVNLPTYDFKLVIKPNGTNKAIVGDGSSVNMGGDVYFENIQVDFGSKEGVFAANGYNVSFPSNVTFVGDGTKVSYAAGSYNATQGIEYNKPVKVENTHPITKFFFASYSGSTTFNEDVNISYAAATNPTFYLTGKNGTTTYNKALNLTVNGTTASSYALAANSTLAFGAEAYMQIYNSSGYSINPASDDLANVPEEKLYVINNISGNSKLLEFTDTKGVYKVNVKSPDHKVIATNVATGVETPYDNTTFTLTLDPGVYDVRLERGPVYETYYLNNETGITIPEGARPDGAGTKDMPVKTFADATRLIAQDGMTDIDVATIVIPSGTTCDYGTGLPELECQLVITSDNSESMGTIRSTSTTYLPADTTLKNATLRVDFSYAETFYFMLNGHDLTVEDDAQLRANFVYLLNDESDEVSTEDQTIISRGLFYVNSISLGARYTSKTIKGDVNIYMDNAENSVEVVLGQVREAEIKNDIKSEIKNTYEGDINITVKSANSFNLLVGKDGVDIKGALNVIVDDSVPSYYDFTDYFNNIEATGGKWFIKNAAVDQDFVDFTDQSGVFTVNDGVTAYTRQLEKDQVTHTGGTIDLSQAPGMYTVSDSELAPILPENPHKMLYFKVNDRYWEEQPHLISTLVPVTPGETYRFEYSIFCSDFDGCATTYRTDGDKFGLVEPKIISKEKIGDYYRIVAEGTIPSTYEAIIPQKPDGSPPPAEENAIIKAHFSVMVPANCEGYIFDRLVYDVKDTNKTNLFEYGNADFTQGLDYVQLDTAFWGVWAQGGKPSYNCGGNGVTMWTDDAQILEVVDYDEEVIAKLSQAYSIDDGEWWDPKDVIKEEQEVLYCEVRGKIVDQNGVAVKDTKFLLISDEKTYSAVSNANGEFDFGKVVSGLYELFIQDGSKKINTGFGAFIAEDEVVNFNIIADTSGLIVDTGIEDTPEFDSEIITDSNINEEVEVTAFGGSLKGTVYTPNLEIVPNLKLVLEGFDDVITDENGNFGFANIPVGEYELYAVTSNGDKYVFAKYEIKESVGLEVKLKYAPSIEDNTNSNDNGWVIWVIIASVIALLIVAALVYFLVIRKKKGLIS